MKNLDKYILEKLHINKDVKDPYTCHPKDKFELRKILEERLSKNKDADLNDIDVSNITDMGDFKINGVFIGLFEKLDPHNIKIDMWDVSNVKDMNSMFYGCVNFNCDLSNWDVSKVKDINSMFYGCEKFNYDLSNWNVSNVKDMGWVFNYCYSLKNKPSWYKE